MKIFSTLCLSFILLLAESCKDKPVPVQLAPAGEISFARPDSLLPPEKIDTSKFESVYRQYESWENDAGTLTIHKDQTFLLQFSGWLHQTMTGNWYTKNDTLNCYVTNAYCTNAFIANANKYSTFKFVLINHNLCPIGDLRNPYYCKKMYDYFIQCTFQTYSPKVNSRPDFCPFISPTPL